MAALIFSSDQACEKLPLLRKKQIVILAIYARLQSVINTTHFMFCGHYFIDTRNRLLYSIVHKKIMSYQYLSVEAYENRTIHHIR
jgi:hypothetical protein